MDPKIADIDSARLAYWIFGRGPKTLVIETAISSCGAEWWHIAERWSKQYTVVVYDRAGYGKSSLSALPRTPENIARELYRLLEGLNLNRSLILIGHSQGGLYAQQFARLYPKITTGVILIDPLSANDNRFQKDLTPEEFSQSGVDKSTTFKLGKLVTTLRLGFLFRSMLLKSPPFYYYSRFSEEAKKYILSSLMRTSNYKTALQEYTFSHKEEYISNLRTSKGFPVIPLILITHSSEVLIEEIMQYGGASRSVAEKIESLWQNIMKEYLVFSPRSKWLGAKRSGHYVHLTEPEILDEALIIFESGAKI